MNRIARLLPAGWSEIAAPALPDGADVKLETFPTLLPAGIATTPLSLLIKDLTFVDAGLRAAQEGYDALLIDTVCDYGLPELRSCTSLPVVGAGESGVRAGVATGEPFAVVTVWTAASGPLFARVLERTGVGEQSLGVRHVFDEAGIAELGGAEAVASGIKSRMDAVVGAIVATCRQAIDDGARAIVLGCTCMSPAASALATELGLPVVDPLAAASVDACAALGGTDLDDDGPSRLVAQRTSTLAEQTQVRRMIAALADSTDAPEPEACPVCVA